MKFHTVNKQNKSKSIKSINQSNQNNFFTNKRMKIADLLTFYTREWLWRYRWWRPQPGPGPPPIWVHHQSLLAGGHPPSRVSSLCRYTGWWQTFSKQITQVAHKSKRYICSNVKYFLNTEWWSFSAVPLIKWLRFHKVQKKKKKKIHVNPYWSPIHIRY